MKSYSYQAIVEAISHLKEDGHTDVPSSIRMCKNIIEDAHDILCALCEADMEDSIDTWWTNKLAVAADSLNKLRDYYTVDVDHNQQDNTMNKYIQGGIKALGDMVKGRRVVHTTPTGHKVTDNFPHTGIVPRIIAAKRARQASPLTRGQTR